MRDCFLNVELPLTYVHQYHLKYGYRDRIEDPEYELLYRVRSPRVHGVIRYVLIAILFSGSSDLDEHRRQLVVDNTFDGFDLFSINDCQWVRTFVTPPPTTRYPKQVTFGESGAVVVGGSDHGLIRVFDTQSGDLIDVLHHSDGGLVQTVTVIHLGILSTRLLTVL